MCDVSLIEIVVVAVSLVIVSPLAMVALGWHRAE